MKLFETFRINFALIGITSSAYTLNSGKKWLTSLIVWSSCILNWIFFAHEANTFIEYTTTIYLATAFTVIAVCFTRIIFQTRNIFKFIDGCEKMIENESTVIYNEVNRQLEKWSEVIYFVVAEVVPICWIMPKFIHSLVVYFTTDLGNDAFELPILEWFPFNTKNPFGYLFAVVIQSIQGFYSFFIIANLGSFGTGAYLLSVSVTKYSKEHLNDVNKFIKTNGNRLEMLKSLTDFIQLHSNFKELVHSFSKIYQPIFMALFTWSFIAISGAMLMFETELSQPVVVLATIFYASLGFGELFIVCELCQRLTDGFDEINNVVDQLDWYQFPDEIQKMLPTLLINVQRSVFIECFGNISCCRQVFIKVVNSGFSYFMVLRKFNK